jgi:hypothetical protein
MAPRRQALAVCIAGLVALATHAPAEEEKADSAVLIEWLLQDGRDLKGIPFSEVLAATTGKNILPVPPDAAWLRRLATVLDRTIAAMNDPAHPIHSVGRINEASRFIEDQLMAECNKEPGWSCGIPRTSAGEEQRSGYPDLRLSGSFWRINPSSTSTRNSSPVAPRPAPSAPSTTSRNPPPARCTMTHATSSLASSTMAARVGKSASRSGTLSMSPKSKSS